MNHEIDDLISYTMELQKMFPPGENRPASLDMTLYWLLRLIGQLAHDRVREMELDLEKEATAKLNRWSAAQ